MVAKPTPNTNLQNWCVDLFMELERLGVFGDHGYVFADKYFKGLERSSDPPEPAEGTFVIWMSDGTGKGDDGDIMIASKAGGTTKYGTLFDHSGGGAW